VRILAATNKDLKKEIANGNFREDLYHRLSVILLHVPSLSDRKEDIPAIAKHFLNIICHEYGMPVKTLSDEAIHELQELPWTGNIRELRNVVERLVILCDKTITGKDIKMYASVSTGR
jgi:DNA-binding NtrC family response regulator